MNEFDLTVRRSALRMWSLAVLGVPLLVYAVDILFERRLATTITDLMYPSQNVTPPPFETHDLAWAWVLLITGSLLTGWALKELIAPRRVIHADTRGVALALAGPFSKPIRTPWNEVDNFAAGVASDDGGRYPVLRIQFEDRTHLPAEPWGARWGENNVLSIVSKDWDRSAEAVANRLAELATMNRVPSEIEPVPPAVREQRTWESGSTDGPLVDGPWVRHESRQALEAERERMQEATSEEPRLEDALAEEEDAPAEEEDE